MNKQQISILIVVVMIISSFTVFAKEGDLNYEKSSKEVYIDDVLTDISGLIVNGVEMIPVKQVCKLIGYDVTTFADDSLEITENENCKNSLGTTEKAIISSNLMTKVLKKKFIVGENEMTPPNNITYKINDELYMQIYFFTRMLDLKFTYADEKKITINTRNYLDAELKGEYGYTGYVSVYNSPNKEIEIFIDNEKLQFVSKPFIDEDERLQVPVREFCEFLNKKVAWYEDSQTVCISSNIDNIGGSAGGDSYWFSIGEKRYRKNGTYYDMDTSAQIINDRTYVPLRYLVKMMNYYVEYNSLSTGDTFGEYDYRSLNSYMGKERDFVLKQLKLDDSNIILENGKTVDYIVKTVETNNAKFSVKIGFYNNVMIAFYYVFSDIDPAFNCAKSIHNYYDQLYGEVITYSGIPVKLSDVLSNKDNLTENNTYTDNWNANLSDELTYSIIKKENSKLYLSLRFEVYEDSNIVSARYELDKNNK